MSLPLVPVSRGHGGCQRRPSDRGPFGPSDRDRGAARSSRTTHPTGGVIRATCSSHRSRRFGSRSEQVGDDHLPLGIDQRDGRHRIVATSHLRAASHGEDADLDHTGENRAAESSAADQMSEAGGRESSSRRSRGARPHDDHVLPTDIEGRAARSRCCASGCTRARRSARSNRPSCRGSGSARGHRCRSPACPSGCRARRGSRPEGRRPRSPTPGCATWVLRLVVDVPHAAGGCEARLCRGHVKERHVEPVVEVQAVLSRRTTIVGPSEAGWVTSGPPLSPCRARTVGRSVVDGGGQQPAQRGGTSELRPILARGMNFAPRSPLSSIGDARVAPGWYTSSAMSV